MAILTSLFHGCYIYNHFDIMFYGNLFILYIRQFAQKVIQQLNKYIHYFFKHLIYYRVDEFSFAKY